MIQNLQNAKLQFSQSVMQSEHEDLLQNVHETEVILDTKCLCGVIQKRHVSERFIFPPFDTASNFLSSPLPLDGDEVDELKNILIPSCCLPPLDSSESNSKADEIDDEYGDCDRGNEDEGRVVKEEDLRVIERSKSMLCTRSNPKHAPASP